MWIRLDFEMCTSQGILFVEGYKKDTNSASENEISKSSKVVEDYLMAEDTQ